MRGDSSPLSPCPHPTAGSDASALSAVLKGLRAPPRRAQAPTAGGLAFHCTGLCTELLLHRPRVTNTTQFIASRLPRRGRDAEERRREDSEEGSALTGPSPRRAGHDARQFLQVTR